jgi:hypothetical protein
MQLHEAQALLDRHGPGQVKLVYRSHPDAEAEEGVITSVTGAFVFIRYGADVHSKATRPEDLEPLSREHKIELALKQVDQHRGVLDRLAAYDRGEDQTEGPW